MKKQNFAGNLLIGADIGGSQMKLVALEETGEILNKTKVNTPKRSTSKSKNVQEVLDGIIQFIDKTEHTFTNRSIKKIGICLPGLADSNNQFMYQLPGKLFGLSEFNFQKALGDKYFVRIINDANSALLAEHWLGAAKGFSDVILLTLGTGVGGAIMVNNTLLQGANGRSGHIGQMIMNPLGIADIFYLPGTLETFIGDMYVQRRTCNKFNSAKELADGYLADDRLATSYWLDSIQALSIALVTLINVIDPQAIIIGGGIAEADEALFEPLQSFMDRYEWRPKQEATPILKASFGLYAGAIGAAKFILNYQE